MPYIKQERRDLLDPSIDEVIFALAQMDAGMGDLNYVVTRLMIGMGAQGYTEMSAVRAVANDAADEYYARLMRPYEDRKIKDNGDIPGYELPWD